MYWRTRHCKYGDLQKHLTGHRSFFATHQSKASHKNEMFLDLTEILVKIKIRVQQNILYQAEQGRAFPTICCLHLSCTARTENILCPSARNWLYSARYQSHHWCCALSHLLLAFLHLLRPFCPDPVYHHIFCSTSHSQLQVKGRVANDWFTAQESHWGLTRNVFRVWRDYSLRCTPILLLNWNSWKFD